MHRDEYRFFRGVESYLLRILWLASGRGAARVKLIFPAAAGHDAAHDQPATTAQSSILGRTIAIVVSGLVRTLIPAMLLALFLVFGVLRSVAVERVEARLPLWGIAAGALLLCLGVILALRQALMERRVDDPAETDG